MTCWRPSRVHCPCLNTPLAVTTCCKISGITHCVCRSTRSLWEGEVSVLCTWWTSSGHSGQLRVTGLAGETATASITLLASSGHSGQLRVTGLAGETATASITLLASSGHSGQLRVTGLAGETATASITLLASSGHSGQLRVTGLAGETATASITLLALDRSPDERCSAQVTGFWCIDSGFWFIDSGF